MEKFIQLTVSGLTNGMVYALVALGFVIIYKASDVINFAQGELLLFGAYLAFAFIAQFGLPWTLGILLTLVVAVGIGVVLSTAVHADGSPIESSASGWLAPVEAQPNLPPTTERTLQRWPPLLRRIHDRRMELITTGRARGPRIGLHLDRSRESELHRYGLAGVKPGAVVRLSFSKRF